MYRRLARLFHDQGLLAVVLESGLTLHGPLWPRAWERRRVSEGLESLPTWWLREYGPGRLMGSRDRR